MAPDLNSLPPSPPTGAASLPLHLPRMPLSAGSTAAANTTTISASASDAPVRNLSASSPSVPHSSLPSLAAAAAMNAGIHSEESRRSSAGSVRREAERARRRSSIRMNINLNDPTLPSPGELQMSPSLRSRQPAWPHSPHHERTPSLGELHQELENEQEAQVNRLLNMIRQQQAQILALTSGSSAGSHGSNAPAHPSSSAVLDDSTPTSERSLSRTHSASASQQNIAALSSPAAASATSAPAAAAAASSMAAVVGRSRSPNAGNLSRHSSYRDRSRGSSRTGSPMLRPISSSADANTEWTLGPSSRDESAFYQAETQMLTRENQMLKMRIRELERQLSELNSGSSSTPHTPATASNLHSSSTPPAADGAAASAAGTPSATEG